MTTADNKRTPPPDAKQRARALDTARSFIVRAPAGSGKTTLLIQRYLKLLAGVAQPEEILCMTFTRKAAGEMRSRVLGALQQAQKGGQNEAESNTLLFKLARQALDRDEQHNWGLLQNPSRLQFHTIDGFCVRLVRRLPRASGFGATPAVEEFPAALYRAAAAGAIACMDDEEAGEAGTAGAAARTVLAHFHNNYERLLGLLADMLAVRDQWLWVVAHPEISDKRALLEQYWKEIVRGDLGRLRNAMLEDPELAAEIAACAALAAGHMEEAGSDSPIRSCRELEEPPPAAADGDAPEQWRGLAALLLTSKGDVRKTVNKNSGFPADKRVKPAKERMLRLLGKLHGAGWAAELHAARALPQPRYDDGQWQVLAALITVLKQAAARLNLDIGASGRCDHAAIATSATFALGEPEAPTDLALALDYRIHHILVDEFQDTSESQMRLLEMLTAGWDGSDDSNGSSGSTGSGGRTLFLVGDPMQSIYAFRKADVGIYMNVTEQGIGNLKPECLVLSANFRSQRPLIEWVNKVFAAAMPSLPEQERASGAVEFSPSEVIHDDADSAGVTLHAQQHPAAPGAEAAALIKAVRTERDADPGATIAILARSRSHLPEILRALGEAGVPYQEVGLESLARRPLVQDLLALSCALLHPADRTAWLALLRAPWCGLELRDLERLHSPGSELWERLRDPAVAASLSPSGRERLARVVPVLEQAFAQRGRLPVARWIENTWLALGGAALSEPAAWPDARLFFEQLRQLCGPTGLNDYRELRERLEAVRSEAGGGGDSGKATPVEVMTMHGAKGLEFDVVLIPGLARGTRSDTRSVMQWRQYQGRNAESAEGETSASRLLLAPLSVRQGGDERMYEYIRALDKRRHGFEDGRLMYVACTRARRRLHLFATLKVKEEDGEEELAPPPAGSLLSHIAAPCAAEWEAALDEGGESAVEEAAAAAKAAAQLLDVQTGLNRAPEGWQPPPPDESVPPGEAAEESVDDDDPQRTFDWAGQPARLAGVIVHRMLCLIAEEGLGRWDMERVRQRRAAWAAELEVCGLERDAIKKVVGNVEEALRFCLEEPKGRWILDEGHEDARNEYGISGLLNGRLVRKIIDRTMADADGVCWIIDYKTGSHRGGSLEQFLDNEQQRYRAQLEEYAALLSHMTDKPLRLGLYFPLARGWREWAWHGGGGGNETSSPETVPVPLQK